MAVAGCGGSMDVGDVSVVGDAGMDAQAADARSLDSSTPDDAAVDSTLDAGTPSAQVFPQLETYAPALYHSRGDTFSLEARVVSAGTVPIDSVSFFEVGTQATDGVVEGHEPTMLLGQVETQTDGVFVLEGLSSDAYHDGAARVFMAVANTSLGTVLATRKGVIWFGEVVHYSLEGGGAQDGSAESPRSWPSDLNDAGDRVLRVRDDRVAIVLEAGDYLGCAIEIRAENVAIISENGGRAHVASSHAAEDGEQNSTIATVGTANSNPILLNLEVSGGFYAFKGGGRGGIVHGSELHSTGFDILKFVHAGHDAGTRSEHTFVIDNTLRDSGISGQNAQAVDSVSMYSMLVEGNRIFRAQLAYKAKGSSYDCVFRNNYDEDCMNSFNTGPDTGSEFMNDEEPIPYDAYRHQVYNNISRGTEGRAVIFHGAREVFVGFNTYVDVASTEGQTWAAVLFEPGRSNSPSTSDGAPTTGCEFWYNAVERSGAGNPRYLIEVKDNDGGYDPGPLTPPVGSLFVGNVWSQLGDHPVSFSMQYRDSDGERRVVIDDGFDAYMEGLFTPTGDRFADDLGIDGDFRPESESALLDPEAIDPRVTHDFYGAPRIAQNAARGAVSSVFVP